MIRLAAALVLAWAAAAEATQDAWPALYDVAGVAEDDVLNVRAAPDAAAPIVATLTHDAAGIEVIRPGPRHDWGLVNTGEGIGWVSLAYMARRPGQWAGAVPEVAQCFGTEPFWSLLQEAGTLRLDRPGADGTPLPITWQGGTLAHRGRYALTAGDGATGLAVTLAVADCGDGMSDRAYGIEATVIVDGTDGPDMLWGCCSLAR